MGYIDPIYQQQQQQYFYNKGLERAKKAQREHRTFAVKPKAVLMIVLILVLAGGLFFALSGVLSRRSSSHVRVDGILYRVGDQVVSMDEGFASAGELVHVEDLEHSDEDFATDLTIGTTVYVNPRDRSKIYIRWQGHYLKCPQERRPFP